MHTILILMAVAGMAVADVSHLGYQYKVPHTSYGVPAYQSGNNGGFASGSGIDSRFKEQSFSQSYQGSGFGTGLQSSGNQGGYQGAFAQSSAGQGAGFNQQNRASQGNYHGASFGQQTSGGQGGYQGVSFGQQYSGNSGYPGASYQNFGSSSAFTGRYQSSSQNQGAAAFSVHQQPAQVFKHVYVHEAPEEPEPPRPRQQLVLPPPQKHYKIIFIKAPTSTVYAPKYIPVPQQTEEKTIVYLLTKKSEELQDEVVPQIESKPPAKPEVFFVKYQNKEDSQAVINNIVQEHNKGASSSGHSGAVFDNGSTGSSSGYFSQNAGSGQLSSGEYSQQGGSATGGSGTYFVQHDSASGIYGQGGQQSVQGTSSPAKEYLPSGTLASVPSSTYGAPSFDGTVDTVVATSQGLPHTTYSNFRD